MKIIQLFLVLLLLPNFEASSGVLEIVRSIIKVTSSARSTINLITATETLREPNMLDLRNEIAKMTSKIGNARMDDRENLRTIMNNRPKLTNFILVDTIESFTKFHKAMNSMIFKFDSHFILILINGRIAEFNEIFKLLWMKQIYNVNVIYEDKNLNDTFVWTFFPFTPKKCNNTEAKLLIKFSETNLSKMTSNAFFPPKFGNLFGCPIKVAAANNENPFLFINKHKNGSVSLRGRDIELLNALSELINFKIDYAYIGPQGTFRSNGSSDGAFKELVDGRVDIGIADFWLKTDRLKLLDATNPYVNQRIVFVMPKASKLSSLEKLIKPFSTASWMLILVGFTFGSFVIFVIRHFTSPSTQRLVFGSKIQSPCMNMLIGIFGGSQHILPRRNFARFLLIMFLMKCLILRSIYQGILFEILQTNQYHKTPQTIDEIIDSKLELYVSYGSVDFLVGTLQKYGDRWVIQGSFQTCSLTNLFLVSNPIAPRTSIISSTNQRIRHSLPHTLVHTRQFPTGIL